MNSGRKNITLQTKIMQSSKNKLQEFCQANRMLLPIYELVTKSGPPHAPLFLSRVLVGESQFMGTCENTKTLSEHSAANYALQYFNELKDKSVKMFNTPTILFGDVENLPREFEKIEGQRTVNLDLCCVKSPNANYTPKSQNTKTVKINCTRRDACDIAIVILAAAEKKRNIIVLSKDLFADTLSEVLQQMVPGSFCRVVRSYEEFMDVGNLGSPTTPPL